jgi:polyphenol oxidase
MTTADSHRTVLVPYRDALVRSALVSAIPGIRHGITGRLPGVGIADANVGFSPPRDRPAAWLERQRWCNAAGIDPAVVTVTRQVHGATVLHVGAAERGRGGPLGSDPYGEADGLMTNVPGVAVMTLHADCMPILLADPDGPAVCAIHAGWRGTTLGIAEAAVRAMADAYGSDPARLVGYLGPSIGGCCYEVGDEVVDAWRQLAGADGSAAIVAGPRKAHLDLVVANRHLLERAGVPAARIEVASVCTRCDGDRWFSHRGQGADTGRFGAIIGIAPADDDMWGEPE